MLPVFDPIPIYMVAYFRPQDLIVSLDSILENTTLPYKLFVIDNSHGEIDETLDQYEDLPHTTIIRNSTNKGKGQAFMEQYRQYNTPYFISIDGDIIVPPRWLERIDQAYWTTNAPILAPIIGNHPDETFEYQLAHGFNMHKITEPIILQNKTFTCRYTSGPLFAIDTDFFKLIGGYPTNQIYGNEDGELCRRAATKGRLPRIISDLQVLHSNIESDSEYKQWKLANVRNPQVRKGRWD